MDPLSSSLSSHLETPQETLKRKRSAEILANLSKTRKVSTISGKISSLYCNETLDFDDIQSSTPSSKPLFTEHLIINYLSQISEIHKKDWKWLQEQSFPPFIRQAVHLLFKALSSNEPPESRHEMFVWGLVQGTLLCSKDKEFHEIKLLFGRVTTSMYTRINALKIHREALKHYTPQKISSDPDIKQELLSGISGTCPFIVTELASLWSIAFQASGSLDIYLSPNLPNQLFQVSVPQKKDPITFFRMQSPESEAGMLDPLYLQFLASLDARCSSHLSLVMLSPHIFDSEQQIAGKRFQLQWTFRNSLNVWRCEPDSDFVSQDAEFSREEPVEDFLHTLRKHLFKESSSFEILKEIRESTHFKNQVEQAILFVKNLFFADKKTLNKEEKQDYVIMCVALLMENFCDDLEPFTVDTACRSHIDRGMMISTIIYIYLMIKSGKEKDKQFLNYLKVLTLAPALIVAQRPPHLHIMKRVLSLACRLLQPNAIQQIKTSQTFFSGCSLTIPQEEFLKQ